MTDLAEDVRRHYESGIDSLEALLHRLSMLLGGLDGSVSTAALAALDQFHVGGLTATGELARRADVRADVNVLDAGCGFGGPSRYLAETFRCRVVGVDLSPDFIAISRFLTERTGLTDLVSHHVGDLTSLAFEDETFDLVWTQHVVMNIADRDHLYGELRRVLKRGCRFAFYDPIAADGHPEVRYPTPWAASSKTSTLLTEGETRAALDRARLKLLIFDDVTRDALGWLQQQQQAPAKPSPLSLGLVLGLRAPELVANFARNLGEGRLRLVMGVCTAV
jgi:SAM-dependent methyltransferase